MHCINAHNVQLSAHNMYIVYQSNIKKKQEQTVFSKESLILSSLISRILYTHNIVVHKYMYVNCSMILLQSTNNDSISGETAISYGIATTYLTTEMDM